MWTCNCKEGERCRCGGGVVWRALALAAVAYVVLLARNAYKEYQYIGRPEAARDTIAISAEGKVTARPDVATVSIGVQTEKKTVSEAQNENTSRMNAIVDRLKAMGIAAEDIKTSSYSIWPQYDYVNGRQVDRGFMVSQSVEVKIRNLDLTGKVLGAAGELGANQVGGVNFTIDDPEALRQQARLEALEKAKEKARALAQAAGVKLGKVVGFSESPSYDGPVLYKAYGEGYGGGGAAPAVEPGSQDVVVNVSVTYEILP